MKRSWLLGSAMIVALRAYAGCSTDGADVVAELDGGAAPGFVARDAGDALAPPSDPVLACIGTECPEPYATCPSRFGGLGYKCQNNLLTDNDNCGTCGNVCPPNMFGSLHMATRCVAGACQRECVPDQNHNFKDCNGQVDDGCEVDISFDAENCGDCGSTCPDGQRCFEGKCGCPRGQTDCGDVAGCRDTTSDDFHCGRCGHRCEVPEDAGEPPPNMEYGCGESRCGELRCSVDWANCDTDLRGNGCETNTATDPDNCGMCGHECAPGQICLSDGRHPPECMCDPGQTLCGAESDFYRWCADLLTDPRNCGACGHECPGALSNGAPTCRKGFCDYDCELGWGDCDGDPSNGCETNLMINGGNCGVCGHRCDTAGGQPCIAGKCLMVECDAGETK